MKKTFTALSIVAMVNLAGLAGVVVYAKARHWLTQDRVRKALAVLKGEEAVGQPGHAEAAAVTMATSRPSDERPRRDDARSEIVGTELDRRTREIQDAWSLLETQQLAVVRDREALDDDKARLAEAERRKLERSGDGGLQKEMEIIGGLKPKQAKELLRQKQDADVVALLKAMEERKVRKIAGECKSEEERRWIGRILESLTQNPSQGSEQTHDRALTQAEVLSAGTQ